MEKGLRPEVTREQMYAVIEHLQEAIEAMIDDEVETEEPEDSAEIESMAVVKASEDCVCKRCKEEKMSCENCPDCVSKSYDSDNEEEDKWNNLEKACWSGYKQVGMKEKNGRMVPNCVPVEKSYDKEDKEEPIKKSIWNGTFIK
jgi:hypothetical protein